MSAAPSAQQLAVKKQVEQMKSSIIMEAKEKALEIEHKAMSEAETRKAEEVRRHKAAKDVECRHELEAVRMELRVEEAKQKKASDDQVLQTRVDAVEEVRAAAKGKLEIAVRSPEYGKLLQQLTVQGAFVLEGNALVRCRAEDKGKINLPAAAKAAEQYLVAAGRPKRIALEWDERDAPESVARDLAVGGVYLTLAGDSKITCDNTLVSRLGTCLEEYAPMLRHNLFAERAVRAA